MITIESGPGRRIVVPLDLPALLMPFTVLAAEIYYIGYLWWWVH